MPEQARSPTEFAKLVFDNPSVNPVRVVISEGGDPTLPCVFCADQTEPCTWTIGWVTQDGVRNVRVFHERHLGEEMT